MFGIGCTAVVGEGLRRFEAHLAHLACNEVAVD